MRLIVLVSVAATVLRMAYGSPDWASRPEINGAQDRLQSRERRPVYIRQVYEVELCSTYHPQRINCTLAVRDTPPTHEDVRYRVCKAHCRLATVCSDVACTGCMRHAFVYRHIRLYGTTHLCRPLPCERRGFVRFADYACRRARRCTVARCRSSVFEVAPRHLHPFRLQSLVTHGHGHRAQHASPTEPLSVSFDERIALGRASVGETFKVIVALDVPTMREDVVLLADATSSAAGALRSLRASARNVVSSRRGTRFGVAYFRDEAARPRSRAGFALAQALTGRARSARAAIRRLRARGGADRAEAGLVALMELATDAKAGWRAGARKVVVLIGDAPQHEPVCVHDAVLTRADVVKALNARGIAVLAIDVGGTGLDDATTPFGCGEAIEGVQRGRQMSTITKGTGGMLVRNVPQQAAAQAVVNGLRALPLRVEVDTSDCAQEFGLKVAKPLPRSVMYGQTITVRFHAVVRKGACTTSSLKKCIVRYIVGGATVALQEISVEGVFGCKHKS